MLSKCNCYYYYYYYYFSTKSLIKTLISRLYLKHKSVLKTSGCELPLLIRYDLFPSILGNGTFTCYVVELLMLNFFLVKISLKCINITGLVIFRKQSV